MFSIGNMENIKRESKAQLHQDFFVLWALNNLTNGYYVEFGATNGVSLSNTWLLENKYGWKGILAEPGRCWHNDLLKNRANDSNNIELKCVWSKTGEVLKFNEVKEISTIDQFSSLDMHKELRKHGNLYDVETISLMDMLDKYDAPKRIDYLSIDTEGSEFEILNSFDFSKYRISVITCEHNYTPMRKNIFDLLTGKGYVRVFPEMSDFDDWYVFDYETVGK